MNGRETRSGGGFTLIEVMLVVVLVAILLLLLNEVIATLSHVQGRIRSQDVASTVSRKVMEEIRATGLASRKILIDDAQGQGFLAALETGPFPILPGSRLPMGDPTAPLVPDAVSETLTGNAIIFSVREPPLIVNTTGGDYRIDMVRFVSFYLTLRSVKAVARRDDRLDLVRFTSRCYPERAAILAVPDDGDRTEVIAALRAEGMDVAWVPTVTVDQAFHTLESDDSLNPTPLATPTIETAPDGWVAPLFGSKHMSVAGNGEAANVPLFAQPVVDEALFPSGFEVKVVGPSSGRRLLTRLVLLAASPTGHDVVQESLRVLTLRDL